VSDLSTFEALVAGDHGLSVVSTLRSDGSIQSSVVNAGVLDDPRTGERVVAFVVAGGARKLGNLRADPRCSVVVRTGWQWAGVEGTAEILGPDELDAEALRLLLRDVFRAAGGTHDDWDTFDRVMAEERRAAILVTPQRTYGVPGG
jgi:PPOX class probable F420-dependent enzyme